MIDFKLPKFDFDIFKLPKFNINDLNISQYKLSGIDLAKLDYMTVLAYAIIGITTITMLFGILAYSVYKAREIKRATMSKKSSGSSNIKAIKKYLFFEEREIII